MKTKKSSSQQRKTKSTNKKKRTSYRERKSVALKKASRNVLTKNQAVVLPPPLTSSSSNLLKKRHKLSSVEHRSDYEGIYNPILLNESTEKLVTFLEDPKQKHYKELINIIKKIDHSQFNQFLRDSVDQFQKHCSLSNSTRITNLFDLIDYKHPLKTKPKAIKKSKTNQLKKESFSPENSELEKIKRARKVLRSRKLLPKNPTKQLSKQKRIPKNREVIDADQEEKVSLKVPKKKSSIPKKFATKKRRKKIDSSKNVLKLKMPNIKPYTELSSSSKNPRSKQICEILFPKKKVVNISISGMSNEKAETKIQVTQENQMSKIFKNISQQLSNNSFLIENEQCANQNKAITNSEQKAIQQTDRDKETLATHQETNPETKYSSIIPKTVLDQSQLIFDSNAPNSCSSDKINLINLPKESFYKEFDYLRFGYIKNLLPYMVQKDVYFNFWLDLSQDTFIFYARYEMIMMLYSFQRRHRLKMETLILSIFLLDQCLNIFKEKFTLIDSFTIKYFKIVEVLEQSKDLLTKQASANTSAQNQSTLLPTIISK